ncbi:MULTISPECIES: GerMN domain-containing protein [unclassified Micromonospora]|uniref:GerMN domain-containing protein n=1 Tax=unclassified Micromonospora TaxID=2617518 RepID=UPI002FF1185B
MTYRWMIMVCGVMLAAGCGVPVDDAPRRVSAPPGPFAAPPAGTAPTSAGRIAEPFCFVRDDRLVRVVRPVDYLPDIATHLGHLLAGPAQADRDAGLSSALTGTALQVGARLTGGIAEVEVAGAAEDSGRSDEILAFGQIVCTLTSRADVHAVSFRRDGQPLEVPRADGSLTTDPLGAADYRPLMASR